MPEGAAEAQRQRYVADSDGVKARPKPIFSFASWAGRCANRTA